MEEFNQLVLQQAGVIPSPSKDKIEGSSLDNENDSSDTCTDADYSSAKDKEEQNIEQSNNIEHRDTPGYNNTAVANSGILLLDATVAEQQNGISHRSEVAK